MDTLPLDSKEAALLTAHFEKLFGAKPDVIAVGPGRVNLIGEHTDYQDGFVFPFAIGQHVRVAAARTEGPSTVTTTAYDQTATFDVRHLEDAVIPTWARYAAGMAWALQSQGHGTVSNIRAVIETSIEGSGLSSSAAMEMSFGTLWRSLDHLHVDDPTLAKLGQLCENEFVGMRCGIMDQTASLFGVAGHALFIDTREPGKPVAVGLPDALSVVVCDTTVKHELVGSEYNDRRRETEEAAALLGVPTLRDSSLAELEAAKGRLSDVQYRRARHVITENARVIDFREALRTGDLSTLGRLLVGSHTSLRDDFEVSCAELDAMSDVANAQPACIGARMSGGGFGGACVALVQRGQEDAFIAATAKAYHARTGIQGAFGVHVPSAGARAEVVSKTSP